MIFADISTASYLDPGWVRGRTIKPIFTVGTLLKTLPSARVSIDPQQNPKSLAAARLITNKPASDGKRFPGEMEVSR
jgi:hypothetical protein